MATITMVKIYDYKDGRQAFYVYYKNKNRYRRDRVRLYPTIPASAKKFIETAEINYTRNFPEFSVTTYEKAQEA